MITKIVRRVLRPKHTAASVACAIVQGLEDENITLSPTQKELIPRCSLSGLP